MKWLIIEDALKDKRGHYFEYLSTFKRGLEACGDEVAIFTDKTAESWIKKSLGSTPALPRCIWRRMNDGSPRWKKLLRYPLHGWQTFLAWASIFSRGQQANIVFVPSVFTHHLVGIVSFLLLFGRRTPCKFLLFFPSTPICFDEASARAHLNPDPTARLFPWLLRRLRRLVSSGKVMLGIETRAMGDALSSLTGLPFTYFPHPVALSDMRHREEADAEHACGKPLTFGAYGFARHEKGSDLLQEAVKIVLRSPTSKNIRFSIQWTEDFLDGSGGIVRKDPGLSKHPQVEFIETLFDPEGGYERQLAKTDVMVLPYRDSYRYRLSRVVIEAMTAGMPVVVSPNTTLEEQAKEHGAAVICKDLSPEEIALAILDVTLRFNELSRLARERAPSAVEHFSVGEFRSRLLSANLST